MQLLEDYNVAHPYAQIFGVPNTNARRLEVGGLPMCRKDDGSKLVAGWERNGDTIYAKNNLFEVNITLAGRVALSCVNDQPNGSKKNDEAVWQPNLVVGGEEVAAVSEPVILETDPMNENYHDNVLEIDYGVCKRRLRIIEGRFREMWIFAETPSGDIEVRHNKSGKLPLKLGHGSTDLDIEVIGENRDIEKVVRQNIQAAIKATHIGGSGTFYPDANAETNTVDGYVSRSGVDEALATIIAGAGTAANDSGTNMLAALRAAYVTVGQYQYLHRSIFLFDTSSIGSSNTLTGAVLSLYISQVQVPINTNNYYRTYIVSSNPASNTALVAADYSTLGSTSFCDGGLYVCTTAEAVVNYNLYQYYDLNSSGLSNISKTSVSKFGLKTGFDMNTTAFNTWTANKEATINISTADRGASYQPLLTVYYDEPSGGRIPRIRNHGV